MHLNRVEICGGVTREPSIRQVGERNATVAELSVALNGVKYDRATRSSVVHTTYVTVQAWGDLADTVVALNLGPGCEVWVLGELDQSEYAKQDGTKERKTRIVAALLTVTRSRHTSPSPSPGPAAHEPPTSGQQWGPPPPNYDEPPF